jgi:hypothetical protein
MTKSLENADESRKCRFCGKSLEKAKKSINGRPLGRPRVLCADCSGSRRAEPVPPASSSSHRTEAEAVIDAVRVILGSDYTAQDAAEAGALRSLAAAVDSDPSNVSGLRELRLNLTGYRRLAFRPNLGEQEELGRLIASISFNHATRPSLFQDVYAAAIEAGAPPKAAQAAAQAATSSPPLPGTARRR